MKRQGGKRVIKGIGASPGIAIGKAFVVPAWEWDFPDKAIDVTDLAYEFERLYEGIRSSKKELESIKLEFKETVGHEESAIFDAHLAILEDPIFMNEIQAIIERQYKAAEVAVKEVIDKFVGMFDLIDDEYMQERAADIRDVGNRLLKHLLGDMDGEATPPTDHPYILVAKELAPSQLAQLDPSKVLGIATMLGGKTSHTAIMARAMSLPFVLGLEGKLMKPIQTGDLLIVDGMEGKVYVNPGEAIVSAYRERAEQWHKQKERLQEIADVVPMTVDRKLVRLMANINAEKELDQALRNGACGVGLFRTEYLYMDRDMPPSEEEQFEVYRKTAEKLGGKPLVIRTLDIGGDKRLDYMALAKEENPFLGYRAIRISLDRPDFFKEQLRAVLRASCYGNIKLMYPMISSVEEVRAANELLEQAKRELAARGQPFNAKLEVGITIEVPSAVMVADALAKEVSFFSIGTNDLIQYTLAVDRMNETIANLYEPFHPAVLQMLRMTVEAAKRANIPVAVCGELAGDVKALPIWLGLGIEELSISVQSILQVKDRLLQSDQEESRKLLSELLTMSSAKEIHERLALEEQRFAVPAGD
jgi:phosphotransferase system enzyme I (PtsI)